MSSINELDAPGPSPGASSAKEFNAVLVLGVGNVMMGDEGFGVHAVRRLLERYHFPPGVDVVDGGVGGLKLLPLIQSAKCVLIIDVVEAAAKAGSVFMFDSTEIDEDRGTRTSLHDTGILDVVHTAALLGERPEAIVVGVQPEVMDEFGAGLSDPVAASMERVIELVCEQLELRGLTPHPKGRCSQIGGDAVDA